MLVTANLLPVYCKNRLFHLITQTASSFFNLSEFEFDWGSTTKNGD
jgi:hypothetical protein